MKIFQYFLIMGLGDRIDVFFHAFSDVYSRLGVMRLYGSRVHEQGQPGEAGQGWCPVFQNRRHDS